MMPRMRAAKALRARAARKGARPDDGDLRARQVGGALRALARHPGRLRHDRGHLGSGPRHRARFGLRLRRVRGVALPHPARPHARLRGDGAEHPAASAGVRALRRVPAARAHHRLVLDRRHRHRRLPRRLHVGGGAQRHRLGAPRPVRGGQKPGALARADHDAHHPAPGHAHHPAASGRAGRQPRRRTPRCSRSSPAASSCTSRTPSPATRATTGRPTWPPPCCTSPSASRSPAAAVYLEQAHGRPPPRGHRRRHRGACGRCRGSDPGHPRHHRACRRPGHGRGRDDHGGGHEHLGAARWRTRAATSRTRSFTASTRRRGPTAAPWRPARRGTVAGSPGVRGAIGRTGGRRRGKGRRGGRK